MNKWQMNGGVIKWDARGGHATCNQHKSHYSIHPLGRKDSHRDKQRKRKLRMKGA